MRRIFVTDSEQGWHGLFGSAVEAVQKAGPGRFRLVQSGIFTLLERGDEEPQDEDETEWTDREIDEVLGEGETAHDIVRLVRDWASAGVDEDEVREIREGIAEGMPNVINPDDDVFDDGRLID